MRSNKFVSNNSNKLNSNNNYNSIAYKFYNQLQLEKLNILKHATEKITNNQPLDSEFLNEILRVDQQSLRLNREMMKHDHSNLIKDNLNNKPLLFTQFNQFLEMYNRNQHHSIADHTEEIKILINNFVGSIYDGIKIKNKNESLSDYPPQLKFFQNYLLKTYNQLEFGRANQIKENAAMILSDPERPTSFDPIIVDHEHIAKFNFIYMFKLKSINCFQGRGSPDLLVSTHDLKKLGLINKIDKLYLYADFKTGSYKTLGYNEANGKHDIDQFIQFVNRYPEVELFIIDIHPYTNNINDNNIDQYEKLINYLKDCKEELKYSTNDLIRNKNVLFFDSNIPKVNIDDYYAQLADLNEIDPEVFDLFKELIEGYIDYLEKSKNNVNNINNSDLNNAYIKNDAGIYLPQHLASSFNNETNENSSNISVVKSVALTLKYINTTHLTDEELDDFFSE